MKRIVVTGGTRGLGLAIVRRALDAGYRVAVIARQETDGFRDLRSEAAERLAWWPFDLSDCRGLEEWTGQNDPWLNESIHGLVNNAATAYAELVTNVRLDPLIQLQSVNVIAPVLLTRAVLRNMLLHETRGSIVHISSVAAAGGYRGLAMYGATKAAMEAFSRGVARELGPRGIRSNTVATGFMDTDMSAGISDEDRERIHRRSSLGEPVDVDSVAATVMYLLGDESRSVTGQTWGVDAGV